MIKILYSQGNQSLDNRSVRGSYVHECREERTWTLNEKLPAGHMAKRTFRCACSVDMSSTQTHIIVKGHTVKGHKVKQLEDEQASGLLNIMIGFYQFLMVVGAFGSRID